LRLEKGFNFYEQKNESFLLKFILSI
jgi:hypothetical protein